MAVFETVRKPWQWTLISISIVISGTLHLFTCELRMMEPEVLEICWMHYSDILFHQVGSPTWWEISWDIAYLWVCWLLVDEHHTFSITVCQVVPELHACFMLRTHKCHQLENNEAWQSILCACVMHKSFWCCSISRQSWIFHFVHRVRSIWQVLYFYQAFHLSKFVHPSLCLPGHGLCRHTSHLSQILNVPSPSLAIQPYLLPWMIWDGLK